MKESEILEKILFMTLTCSKFRSEQKNKNKLNISTCLNMFSMKHINTNCVTPFMKPGGCLQ